jgi:hypothetical protein
MWSEDMSRFEAHLNVMELRSKVHDRVDKVIAELIADDMELERAEFILDGMVTVADSYLPPVTDGP